MKCTDAKHANRGSFTPRKSGFELPATIVADMIGAFALIVISLGLPFILAMLT